MTGPLDRDVRVGDAERDEAAHRLSQHLAAGRLTIEEFQERSSRALEARTRGDLLALFADLPGEPYPTAAPRPVVARPPAPDAKDDDGKLWIWWGAFIIVLLTGFRMWPLLVLAALWVWVVQPARERRLAIRAARPTLANPGDEAVRQLVREGRRDEAVREHRRVHDSGLWEARRAVERIEREEQARGY